MLNTDPHDALTCRRAAFEWLTLARRSHDPQERARLLAISEAWLEMAQDAFAREQAPVLH